MRDKGADQLWAGVLDELRGRTDPATFTALLQGSHVVETGKGRLTIGVVRVGAADWLEHRLRGVVERAVELVAGRPVAVSFVAGSPPREGKDEKKEEEDEQQHGETTPPESARPQRNPDGDRLTSLDTYIRIKTAFRFHALGELSGSETKVFLGIALHLDSDGTARPGLETIMKETRLSRSAVCSALARLVCLGLVSKQAGRRQRTRYVVEGYAWFGPRPAPALWEQVSSLFGP